MNTAATTQPGPTTPNPPFSLLKIRLLIRWYFTDQKRLWLFTALLFGGIVSLLTLIAAIFASDTTAFSSNAAEMYVRSDSVRWQLSLSFYALAGYYFTSRLFQAMHRPESGWQLLMLPASAAEKFAAAWLLTAPVYTLAAFLFLWLLKFLLMLMLNVIAGTAFVVPALISVPDLNMVQSYFFWHAIFLWGAVFFKSHHFLKAANTAVASSLLVFLLFIGGWMLTGNSFISFFTMLPEFRESGRVMALWYTMRIAVVLFVLWLGYNRFTQTQLNP
ncbi:MAG: hypothetical protein JJU35_01275 [Balneolales bacterium]|nr:hypothetical protein [Balneolales bacterium]